MTLDRDRASMAHNGAMKLDSYMKLVGKSDADLAKDLGVDRSTVNKLRSGKGKPSFKVAERIFKVTGGAVTANDFLESMA